MSEFQCVLDQFCLETSGEGEGEGEWSVVPLGNGNINGTYAVKKINKINKNSKISFVLQEINHNVFKDVDGLMSNMVSVTDHLRAKGVRTLELVPVRDLSSHQYHYFSPTEHKYWRVFKYIPFCKSADDQSLITCQDVFVSAKAFGDFQYQLRDLELSTLRETIPNFHNTRYRFNSFQNVLKNESLERLKTIQEIRDDIDFILSRENKYVDVLLTLKDAVSDQAVPLRVVHNDTKISNVLLSEESEEAVCVIDLDTVMPGISLYDFADIVRSTCSTCGEEEAEFSLIKFRLDMFHAAADGYLSSQMCFGVDMDMGSNGRLWPAEIDHLYIAGQVYSNCDSFSDCRTYFSML
jgi:hypothetical protein